MTWADDVNNWKDLLSVAAEGSGAAARSITQGAKNKKELKEAKRQTYADLLKNAMRRDFGLYKSGQDYSDEMSDLNTNAIQNVARGFAESLRGSTRRRRRGNV